MNGYYQSFRTMLADEWYQLADIVEGVLGTTKFDFHVYEGGFTSLDEPPSQTAVKITKTNTGTLVVMDLKALEEYLAGREDRIPQAWSRASRSLWAKDHITELVSKAWTKANTPKENKD